MLALNPYVRSWNPNAWGPPNLGNAGSNRAALGSANPFASYQDTWGLGGNGMNSMNGMLMMMLPMMMMDPQLLIGLVMMLANRAQQQQQQQQGGRNFGQFPNLGFGNGRSLGANNWGSGTSPQSRSAPRGFDPSVAARETVGRVDSTPLNGVPNQKQYKPGSAEAVALFKEAARKAGVPESWASSKALHNILQKESNGQVGRPNYTYGRRAKDPSQWASVHNELKQGIRRTKSSATGLGQLLLANVDKYYPSGRAGIGNPVEEAAGMLSYIKDRYGSPERAWQLYGKLHEGY